MKNKTIVIGIVLIVIVCFSIYVGGFLYINFKQKDGISILA